MSSFQKLTSYRRTQGQTSTYRHGEQRKWLPILIVAVLLSAIPASVRAETPVPDAPDAPVPLYLPLVTTAGKVGEAGADIMVYRVPAAQQKSAENYWTHERRSTAQALKAPHMDVTQIETAAALEPVGPPQRVNGGLPATDANAVARAYNSEEWQRIEQEELELELEVAEYVEAQSAQELAPSAVAGTRGVYNSYVTNYYGETWKTYPYRTVGKLYISGGGYCTASVISPNNVLVTAAHCVYNQQTQSWYSGWTFVPADRYGSAPYGTWTADYAVIRRDYADTGAIRYDVAVIKLKSKYINSAWRPVSYYTGWLGRIWNYGYTQLLSAQGYPSNLTSGRYLWTCSAESFNRYTADVVGMGCNMMHGSSGGPWILRYHPYVSGSYNYVGSVVSGDPDLSGGTFYGPRFSSNNIVPLCSAVSC